MLTQIYRLCFVLSTLVLIGCNGFTTKIEEKTNVEIEKEPGYYEQWLYMKTNGTNILPAINLASWLNNSAKRSNSNALVSISEIGPNNIGGRTRGVICDIANPNRLICGGVSGGIFISNNNGGSWAALNDQQLTPSVTGITQNPFLPNIIYYCTGEGSGNSADLGGAGIFKSIDGGNTFNQLPSTSNSNFNSNWAVKCSPKDTNVLYVSTDSKGLFKSTNSGVSFTQIYSSGSEINDFEILPNGKVIFTIKGGGVWASDNGDLGTFTNISSISASSTARGEIAFCKKYPNVVYAAISGPDNGYLGVMSNFYKSSDGGKTFKVTGNPNGTINFGFTWYCLTMAVNDNDSNGIFIGSVNCGYSTDGAQTWKKADQMHADHHVAINLSNNKILNGNDGGICTYSWNDFNNYISLNNGLNITQFYAGAVSPHSGLIMGGTQDNGTNENLSSGADFIKIYGGDGAYAFYHADLENLKYYATQNGALYRSDNPSVNMANNLPSTSDSKWFIHPYDVNAFNGDIITYPANKNIYFSNNGGLNFGTLHTSTVSGSRYFSSASSLSNNPAVFVGGQRSLVGIDSISNVVPKKFELNTYMPNIIRTSFISCIKIIPGTRNKLYLALNNISDSGRVYRVENALSTTPVFKNMSGNLPKGLPVNWVECDPMNPYKTIFAGTDYGLYVTEDSGTTWIKDTRVPSTVVSSIKIHPNNKDIYFFTHGRGVFKGVVNNNSTSINFNKVDNQLAKIFPTPCVDILKIHINETFTNGTYTIFDINGKEVMKGKLESNKTILNTEALNNGKYFISYQYGDKKGHQLFIKVN
ncbi:MAG: T9SS type A sorting domain-containing protein [Bacteroidetes bacterium]|nr:T9SS type A sorting domain-containing protein [Bacteroidota bacterium]